MIRSTEHSKSPAISYNEAVDLIKNNNQSALSSQSADPSEQLTKRNLLQEIHDLESKIEEVNQLLCKTSLEYMVRFQLKDDLEYYHGLIENKRHQLGA